MNAMTLTTRIEPGPACPDCSRCSGLLISPEERRDALCTACADAPALSDVHPDFVVKWATRKVRREEKAAAR